ncbi:MAG TPA: NAD(P)H-dependent glycerol-3-phosphate dehydrogenase [Gemmatimonadaceae bacterium]|jgi:glycerol-3-phosphate dehydrogenase (NAD(P)+)|nr:NAD(P)H-dependent glycerol-3-phosphate dehydrogenase [Gemmatimonadaceae bacterium]
MRCAVVGAGAWGTALADLLARNAHEVVVWAYERDVVEAVNARHANPRFLPGAVIHPSVRATCSLGEATGSAELVVYVTPSHVLRTVLKGDRHAVPADATLVVATKGIERGSLVVMTDVVRDELPGRPVVALSGPSFATEVIARQPTAVVAASTSDAAAQLAQRAFSSETFRVYSHDDVIGVEVGGALKNVIAVATGIAEGLGLGHNPRAALITRGLAEMSRLGVALGASAHTFAGLAGLGDLVLTCTGSLSRNRALGLDMARGKSLNDALATRETVAEGVVTTQSAHALAAREGIEMPIVAAVYRILFERHHPRDAIAELMSRELRAEVDP